jgi:hypothetical protein
MKVCNADSTPESTTLDEIIVSIRTNGWYNRIVSLNYMPNYQSSDVEEPYTDQRMPQSVG